MLSRCSQQHARARLSSARGACVVVRYRQSRNTNLETPSAGTHLRSLADTLPTAAAAAAVEAAADDTCQQHAGYADVSAGSTRRIGSAKQQHHKPHHQQQQGRRGVPSDIAGSATQAAVHPSGTRGNDNQNNHDFLGVVRHLEQQAAEEPTVTATLLHSDAAVAADPPAAATPAQQPARIHLGRRPVQALDFDRMYRQLADFKRAHLTAHVPRHCWDAPELGAWVRQLRKLHKERRLERWKVDRLNLLGFQWRLTEQDAKWHYAYHQLRRYKAVHGSTDIPADYSDRLEKDWVMVARWLGVQGRALAKRKLPLQRQCMLARLGVTLVVPRALVHRHARLQVTNAHERKMLRRAWRQQDRDKAAAQAATADAARAAAQQQLQEEERGLLLRQQLLQDSLQGWTTIPEHIQQELQRLQEEVGDLRRRQQQLQEQPVRRQSLWWQFRRLKPKLRRRVILRMTSGSRRKVAPGAPAAAAGIQLPGTPHLQQQQQQQGSQDSVGTPQARAAGQGVQQAMPAVQQSRPRLQATAGKARRPIAGKQLQPQQQSQRQQAQQQETHKHNKRQRQLQQVQDSDSLVTQHAAYSVRQPGVTAVGSVVHKAQQQGGGGAQQQQQQQQPLDAMQASESGEAWGSSITSVTTSSSSSSSTAAAADSAPAFYPTTGEEPLNSDAGGGALTPSSTPTGALYQRWKSSVQRRHSKQEMAQRLLEQQQVGAG